MVRWLDAVKDSRKYFRLYRRLNHLVIQPFPQSSFRKAIPQTNLFHTFNHPIIPRLYFYNAKPNNTSNFHPTIHPIFKNLTIYSSHISTTHPSPHSPHRLLSAIPTSFPSASGESVLRISPLLLLKQPSVRHHQWQSSLYEQYF